MKKLKVIFDLTLLIHHYALHGCERSGIYFASYNIANQLLHSQKLKVVFYLSEQDLIKFQEIHLLFPNFQHKLKFYKNYTLAKWYRKYKQKYDYTTNKPQKKFYKFMRELLRIAGNIEKKIFHYDAFFSTFLKVPSQFAKLPSFIVIYDTIPFLYPEYFSIRPDWFYELFESLNSLTTCFCISHATKKDVLRFRPDLNEKNLVVTHLATNETFFPRKDEKKFAQIQSKYHIPLDKRYIFSLCTIEPRKNLLRIAKTFLNFLQRDHINDMILCIGGGQWDAFAQKMQEEITSFPNYENYILKIGYVDDEDIPYLYSNAEWFVYTSQYEGFGFPPLEAMACGCPVISSTTSSLPEVVGDAALTIDYDNDEQHIKAYETYYYNSNIREEFARKGLAQAQLFSWKKTGHLIERTIFDVVLSQK